LTSLAWAGGCLLPRVREKEEKGFIGRLKPEGYHAVHARAAIITLRVHGKFILGKMDFQHRSEGWHF
jgi:hypothetical protein